MTKNTQELIINTLKSVTGKATLNPLGVLKAMVGAHNFVMMETPGSVKFNFKGSRKANTCIITLDANDTYHVQFGKLNMRTFDWKIVSDVEGLYVGQMKEHFTRVTGLDTSL